MVITVYSITRKATRKATLREPDRRTARNSVYFDAQDRPNRKANKTTLPSPSHDHPTPSATSFKRWRRGCRSHPGREWPWWSNGRAYRRRYRAQSIEEKSSQLIGFPPKQKFWLLLREGDDWRQIKPVAGHLPQCRRAHVEGWGGNVRCCQRSGERCTCPT